VIKRWVINASPIISLTKIDRIHLLEKLCDEIIIPQGVAEEIKLGGYNDSAAIWIKKQAQPFIQPMSVIDPKVANWDLGLGESHVLSWAIKNSSYEAIIDDLAARKAAKILKIPVRGTLSIIVLAKKRGYIASVREDLDNLIEVGLRISPALIQQAIALAGES
jgi:predicted nucleic acid-binding protein